MNDNTGSPYESRVTADQATANTTATDVPGLSFPIGANEVWEFNARIRHQKSTGTAGLKFAVNAPAGATLEAVLQSTTSGPTAMTNERLSALATLNATALNTVATTNGWAFISGTVVNGATPGNVTVQQAGVTSGNSTVFANSVISAVRIA